MTPTEILEQIERVGPQPPTEALRAALEQKETIVPELITALDRVTVQGADYLKDEDYMLHLCAIYLLAELREPRALEPFLRFFSLPGEQALDLTGDMVTEEGAQILASVCGGDPGPLLKLACDESVNEFVRHEAIEGLLVQAAWGERTRTEASNSLRQLFQGGLAKPGNPYVWAALVGAVGDLHAPELLPEARQAFAEELVDESVLDLAWLEKTLAAEGERAFEEFAEDHQPITDTPGIVSSWLCYEQDEAEDQASLWDDDEDIDKEEKPDEVVELPAGEFPSRTKPVPYAAPPKVGRNEPCPCGSGKKYKKCCGKN